MPSENSVFSIAILRYTAPYLNAQYRIHEIISAGLAEIEVGTLITMPIDALQPLTGVVEGALINNTISLLRVGVSYWTESACNPFALTGPSITLGNITLSEDFEVAMERARSITLAPASRLQGYLTESRPATITEEMLTHPWGRRLVAYSTLLTELIGQRAVMDELPLFSNGQVLCTSVEPLRNSEFVACTWPGLAIKFSEQIQKYRQALVDAEESALDLIPDLPIADVFAKANFVLRCTQASDGEIVELRNTRGMVERIATLCVLGGFASEVVVGDVHTIVGTGDVRIRARYAPGLQPQLLRCQSFEEFSSLISLDNSETVSITKTSPRYLTCHQIWTSARRRLRGLHLCQHGLLLAFLLGPMMAQLDETLSQAVASQHVYAFRTSVANLLGCDPWSLARSFTRDAQDTRSLCTISDWFDHSSVVRKSFEDSHIETLGNLSDLVAHMHGVIICAWVEVIFGPTWLTLTISVDALDERSMPQRLETWVSDIPSYLEAYLAGPASWSDFGRLSSIVCDGNMVYFPRLLLDETLPNSNESLVCSLPARISLRVGTVRALYYNEERRMPSPAYRETAPLGANFRSEVEDTTCRFTAIGSEGGIMLYETDAAGMPFALDNAMNGFFHAVISEISSTAHLNAEAAPTHHWTFVHPMTCRFPPCREGRMAIIVRGNWAARRLAVARAGTLNRIAYIATSTETSAEACVAAEKIDLHLLVL